MRTIKLTKLGACSNAKDFARGFKTPQEAWDACDRVDWLLWLLYHTGPTNTRRAVEAVIEFSEWVLPNAGPLEGVVRVALTAARVCAADPSPANCEAAESAARSAAESARWAAESARWAAESAARWAAESAAESAARSAESARWAAESAARWAARWAFNKRQCDHIRKVCPACPIEKA